MTTTTVALDLGWTDLDDLTDGLAERVRAGGVPDVIVGVLRGGIVAAVMLAHRLGVRDLRAVTAVRTRDDTPGAAKIGDPVLPTPDTVGPLDGMDVLVVDDVIGSGDTLRSVTSLVDARAPGRLRTAVVVVNLDKWVPDHPECPDPSGACELIGMTCRGWVRFPWEAG